LKHWHLRPCAKIPSDHGLIWEINLKMTIDLGQLTVWSFDCHSYFYFQTLYLLSSRIDPAKGGELCRASTICSLSIVVQQVQLSNHTSLMYEVKRQPKLQTIKFMFLILKSIAPFPSLKRAKIVKSNNTWMLQKSGTLLIMVFLSKLLMTFFQFLSVQSLF